MRCGRLERRSSAPAVLHPRVLSDAYEQTISYRVKVIREARHGELAQNSRVVRVVEGDCEKRIDPVEGDDVGAVAHESHGVDLFILSEALEQADHVEVRTKDVQVVGRSLVALICRRRSGDPEVPFELIH